MSANLRHIHIYFECAVKLSRGFDKYCPDPPAYSNLKLVDRLAKQDAFRLEWARQKAPFLLHCTRLARVEAVVFDFESAEYETMYAVPPDTCKPHRISIRIGKGKSPGPMFLQSLHDFVGKKGFAGVQGDRVSYRSSEKTFARHLLRNEAAKHRYGEVLNTVSKALYFKLSSLAWDTLYGPASIGDADILTEQFGLWDERQDRVLARLQTTLNIFERYKHVPPVKV